MVVASFTNTAWAEEPDKAMSQYVRDWWGTERGFPGGPVYAITQTTDGYLWIGTEKGLVRFDGLNFRLFNQTNTPSFPSGPVLGLVGDREGSLWIRMRNPSMLRYRGGKFENVMADLEQAEAGITAMCRGQNGEVYFSALVNGTLRYSEGRFTRIASTEGRPNFLVLSMAETPLGDLWLGTRDSGLFNIKEGRIIQVTNGLPDLKINSLLAVGDQGLWAGTDNGVVRWNGTEFTTAGVSPSLKNIQALAMTQDRLSNIWVSTSTGLLRIDTRGITSFEESTQRTGTPSTALFEDREGNLWTANTQGIERLRVSAFVTYSTAQGMPSESNGPVYVDSGGRAWFAPLDGGLYSINAGRIERVAAAAINKDVVYSITGRKGELWIGRQRGGLTHLDYKGRLPRAETFTEADGLAQNSVYVVHQSRDGTVWAGTLSAGVSRFSNGRFTTLTAADGLASNMINSILESSDGTMWFATPTGLSALSNNRWQTYKQSEGLPSENIHCLLEDSSGRLWIGTSNGLAFINEGRAYAPPAMPAQFSEAILGMEEDKNGSLWIATSSRVLRVNRDRLIGGGLTDAEVREYGSADGLQGIEGVKRHRSVVTDSLGQVWFSLNRGLSVVDPARLVNSSTPAIIHVESVSADGTSIDLRGPVRILSANQRITFNYAGLSLSIPERVKYRYLLEGFDPGWSEAVSTREVAYTNLAPGPYTFRVIASNSDGVWNSDEAIISFEIEPMFWQTLWFRFLIGIALIVILLAFYQLRLRQLTKQLNVRFEERLAERTRIAQELHDTLLQGFLSASMQLHVAVDNLPDDSPAKPRLNRVLQLMRQVTEEGRNAVRGLRSSSKNSTLDLEQAFSRIKQELGIQGPTDFRVIVEGHPRPLRPIIRDEVYRIGREALVNAFRHSRAKSIEIEVEYLSNNLRILVRDDGCGIDPQVLRSGRDGHWGLSGMRERADRIGARLKVRSRLATGTEVELSVPGPVAFSIQSSIGMLNWLTRLFPRKSVEGSTKPGERADT